MRAAGFNPPADRDRNPTLDAAGAEVPLLQNELPELLRRGVPYRAERVEVAAGKVDTTESHSQRLTVIGDDRLLGAAGVGVGRGVTKLNGLLPHNARAISGRHGDRAGSFYCARSRRGSPLRRRGP